MEYSLEDLKAMREAAAAANDSAAVARFDSRIARLSAPAPAPADTSSDAGMAVPTGLNQKMYGIGAPPDNPTEADMAQRRDATTGAIAAATRIAPPLVAAAATAPASLPAFLALGGVAAASDLAGRFVEGQPMNRDAGAEAAKAFAQWAMPIPQVVTRSAPSVTASALRKGVGMVLDAAEQGAATATSAAAGNVVGEIAKRSIQNGEYTGYKDDKEFLKDNALPAVLGGSLGAAAAGMERSVGGLQRMLEVRKRLADMGIENPMLAQINPRWASAASLVDSPLVHERIAGMSMGMVRSAMARVAGAVPPTEDVLKTLDPLMASVDNANAVFATASKEADAARAKLAQATDAATTLPSHEAEMLKAGAQAEVLNAVRAQAAAVQEAKNQAGSLITPTEKAQEVGRVMRQVHDVRSSVGNSLYQDVYDILDAAAKAPAGTHNSGTPLFAKDEVVAAVKDALQATHSLNTPAGSDVVRVLENVPALDPVTGELSKEGTHFSKNGISQLNSLIAEKFPRGTTGLMTAQEKLWNDASHAVTDVQRKTIEALPGGKDALAALDKANAYTRVTKQMADSPAGRVLLGTASGDELRSAANAAGVEVQNLPEHTLKRLATGYLNGEVDEVGALTNFIKELQPYTEALQTNKNGLQKPNEVAMLATGVVTDALRDALLAKHNVSRGVTNWPALLADLDKGTAWKNLPFPIDNLKFGDKDTISAWRKAYSEFKPADLTDEVVRGAMENPLMRTAIENGGLGAGPAIKSATAEQIFNAKAAELEALKRAEALAPAKKKAAEMEAFAQEHGITEAQAAQAVAKAKSDPAMAALEGFGKYSLAAEGANLGDGSVTKMVLGMPSDSRKVLMTALEKNNPAVAEMVQRRVMADALESFVVPGKDGAPQLDLAKVRWFFRGEENGVKSDIAGATFDKLKAVLGPDNTRRLQEFMHDSRWLQSHLAKGKISSVGNQDAPRILAAVGASAPGVAGTPLARTNTGNVVMNLLRKGSYHAASWLLMDPKAANQLAAASARLDRQAALSKVFQSLPVQRSYLLLQDNALASDLADTSK